MKKFLTCFLLFLTCFWWTTARAKEYKRADVLRDFPLAERLFFENLWFYEPLHSIDDPGLVLNLMPDMLTFKGTLPKRCKLLQNLDTRVVYRCLHGDFSNGDYYTYHLFVSVGPDLEGRCLVLGDTQLDPAKLNPGRKPVVYYFKADDCGEYEDLMDYLIRF